MWKRNLDSHVSRLPDVDQFDRIADLFEADLKAGRRPDLDHLLDQVDAGSRARLLLELVLVSLEYTGTAPYRETDCTASEGERSLNPSHSEQSTAHGAYSSQTAQPPGVADGKATPVPSDAIAGYELLNELGRGGMGIVYRARQLSVDRLVALKVIQSSRLGSTDETRRSLLLERFRTEAKAASRLDHENIATVYEIGEFGDCPYYAMRLIEGTSLGKLVQAGPLSPDRAARYLAPIARTIGKLHASGVVHRDLKPSNILIEEATDIPVLTDFGLAKLIDAEHNVTLSDEGFGSPPYMAPEQLMHATSVTGAADIYSLGATLYHLLTGRPPFQAATVAEIARQILFCEPVPVRQLDSSIGRDLETICLKCLEKDEDRRYKTATDLADDLQRFLDRRPVVARPTGTFGRLWRWCRRNPSWTVLVVCFLVVLSANAVTSTIMYIQQQVASSMASRALVDRQFILSNELFKKSLFNESQNPYESLPWLVECLKLDVGTPRESVTRQRIQSVLLHGAELARVYCHAGPVVCATFEFSGSRVVTGSTDGTANVWSTLTGKCVRTLSHSAPIRHAVASHGGHLVATAADDGTVQVWNIESGQMLGQPLRHPGFVRFASFSADDLYLITASSDELIRVWNTADGSSHVVLAAGDPGSRVSCFAISPTAPVGLFSCGNSSVRTWNLSTGERMPLELKHPGLVTCAQFSPDAAAIVTGDAEGKARIWEVDTGELRRELIHSSGLNHVCFTVDSQRIVTTTDDAARIWSIDEINDRPIEIMQKGLKSIAIDPANTAVLVINGDRKAQMWSLQDGKSLDVSFSHGGGIASAQFSNDGASVLTCSADGAARLWNRRDRRRTSHLDELQNVKMVTSTPDSRWILAWSPVGTGSLICANTPEVRYPVLQLSAPATAICISPDAQKVAAVDDKGNAVVWQGKTGERLAAQGPDRASDQLRSRRKLHCHWRFQGKCGSAEPQVRRPLALLHDVQCGDRAFVQSQWRTASNCRFPRRSTDRCCSGTNITPDSGRIRQRCLRGCPRSSVQSEWTICCDLRNWQSHACVGRPARIAQYSSDKRSGE